MASRIAFKRLSAVEVDPSRSHQHEFHATRLRRELGLPDRRTSGHLTTLIYLEDGQPPVMSDGEYTLYDARENKPHRSAEWHLYYTTDVVASVAHAGDLALLYVTEDRLCLVIARNGTQVETDLIASLAVGVDSVVAQFNFIDAPVPVPAQGEQMAAHLTGTPVGTDYLAFDHPIVRHAVRESLVPTTREMALVARDVVGTSVTDVDGRLWALLEAETDIYYAIEANVHGLRLDSLIAAGPTVAEILDFAMAIQQSRKSRRGQSLQNHFGTILEEHRIAYTAQCTTEPGETPDFVMPSCAAYHDVTFAEGQLRMVACKSTAKERWRQVLNEAHRIPLKYLLTLDPALTSLTVGAMAASGVRTFLPRPLLTSAYGGRVGFASLGSVSELVDELRKSQVGHG